MLIMIIVRANLCMKALFNTSHTDTSSKEGVKKKDYMFTSISVFHS